jgi:hypothetical protein
MIQRMVERTAISLGARYARCQECGAIQRKLSPPCVSCDGDQLEILEGLGVPEPRAIVKAEGTLVGYLAAVPGLLLCLGAGATLVLALLLRIEVTKLVLASVALLAGVGLLLVALGFSLISRDAAPWIGKLGEWLVTVVRAIRRKNGSP